MGKGSTDDLDAVVSAVVEGNGSTGIAQPRRRYRSNIPVVQRLQEVEEASLEERLAAEGKVFLMLKPETVKETRYRDRIDASFEDSEFQALKASIKSDGQMSPIGVRPVEGGAYEVIFGHRRLRACRELGFDVKAMVLTDVDDRKLILSMLRENTLRKDVSAYERGLAYKLYIDSRLLTQNDLADELGINKSSVSRYLALAKLPEEVLDSVGDPREIKLMTGNEIFQLWNDASKSTRNAALKALDERSRDILQRRWLTDDKATLHDLADVYGVSAERIRQLEKNAMKKLRQKMGDAAIAA